MSTAFLLTDLPDTATGGLAMLYGAAGSGKTTFAATIPDRPMVIHDFDHNLRSVFLRIPRENLKDIYVIQYGLDLKNVQRDILDFKSNLKTLKEGKELKTQGQVIPAGCKVQVVDSFTGLDELCIRYGVKMNGKDPESAKATLPHYGDSVSMMQILTKSMSGPKGQWILLLAHEYYRTMDKEEGGDTTLLGVQPLVTGKSLLGKIPKEMEELWHLEVDAKTDKRVLHYHSYKRHQCKTTNLQGTGTVEDPTWTKVMKLSESTNTKTSTTTPL